MTQTKYVYTCTSCGERVWLDTPDETGDYETCCADCIAAIVAETQEAER